MWSPNSNHGAKEGWSLHSGPKLVIVDVNLIDPRCLLFSTLSVRPAQSLERYGQKRRGPAGDPRCGITIEEVIRSHCVPLLNLDPLG